MVQDTAVCSPNWQLCATQRGTVLARESMSCADEEGEEEGIDSFARRRSGLETRKQNVGENVCSAKNVPSGNVRGVM